MAGLTSPGHRRSLRPLERKGDASMGNVTDGGSGLFDTIVKLVNVGFAGVGVVVLLLVFIILFQAKPTDTGTRKLHNRFLTWGMSFAFFCGGLSVVAPLLAPKPAA